ncbi:hypothetical protein GCM10023220_18450 [Streptomyces ziwulingensis]|uniref:Uncharacterized protein n=1 Tax=Streptomyces ziwulingensis TaxID=1045501 RepID=A0ABP9BDG9_9ACTN
MLRLGHGGDRVPRGARRDGRAASASGRAGGRVLRRLRFAAPGDSLTEGIGGPEYPAPARAASLRWPATAGTGWPARRRTGLLSRLLTPAAGEPRHPARGTSVRLDPRAAAAVPTALAAPPRADHAEAA